MGRIRYTHNSFSTGIISKKIQGNTEFEGYNNSLDVCENFVIQPTGGVFKRSGTKFVAEAKSASAKLISFCYSADDQYICEFGPKYIRFFTKYGPLMNDDKIVELSTTLEEKSLKSLKTFQQGNIMYVVTDVGIYSLQRISTISFVWNTDFKYTIEPITFMNNDKIALKPNKTSGTVDDPIIITAVNPSDTSKKPNTKFAPLFYESDENHNLVLTYSHLNDSTGYIEDKRVYLVILEVLDDSDGFKKLYAIIDDGLEGNLKELPHTDAVRKWQLGAFTDARGLPKACSMYEGRLFLANNMSYPTGIWGSSKLYNDWTDFFIGSNDADSLQFKLSTVTADEILWMVSQSKLFIGTRWGIYIAGSATYNDEAITPSNFRCRLFENIGASALQPISALDAVFFTDVSERRVHEIRLSAETGTYEATDLSLFGEDLLKSGIIAHAWQQVPIKTYWCVVNDGYLCSLTYSKANSIVAWSKHVISGNHAKVTDIATMHGYKHDTLWMIVRREVQGQFKYYVEYMSPEFDPLAQEEFKQYYLDSGISYYDKFTITNFISASPKIIQLHNIFIMSKLISRMAYLANKNDVFVIHDSKKYKCKLSYTVEKQDQATARVIYEEDNFSIKEGSMNCYAAILENVTIKQHSLSSYTIYGNNLSLVYIKDMLAVLVKDESGDVKRLKLKVKQVFSDRIICIVRDDTYYNKVTLVDAIVYVLVAQYATLPQLNYDNLITFNTEFFTDDEVIHNTPHDVYINKVNGTIQLNNKRWRVYPKNRTQGILYDWEKNKPVINLEFSPFDTINITGNAYKYFYQVPGLDHLAGQTVSICQDGNNQGSTIVPTNGIIKLNQPAMYVSVGLPISSKLKTVPFAGGSLIGSSVGCVGGQKSMWLYLYYSLGGRYGSSDHTTYPIAYDKHISELNTPKSLASGLIKCPIVNSSDIYSRCVYIEHLEPVAFNVLSVTQDIEVSDS